VHCDDGWHSVSGAVVEGIVSLVAFFGNSYPSDEGSGDLNTSAVDIAHAMMEKVSALS
jgi:hypothetical protein